MYGKDSYKAIYELLVNKNESAGLQYLNDSKAFIEYSSTMDGIHRNIEEYDPHKKQRIIIVFDDMIADMLNDKKLNPVVTELFIIGRKLNATLVFIIQIILK